MSNPSSNHGWGVLALNPMEFDFEGDPQLLVVLAVGVGVVLLIVCANVTNLLFARAATRRREIATRLALGASRPRIALQFLIESLMLAAAGSVAGVFLTHWAARLVSWSVAGTTIGWMNVSIDARVLTAAAVVSGGCALLVGLLPAFRLSRTSLMAGLKTTMTSDCASSSSGEAPSRRSTQMAHSSLPSLATVSRPYPSSFITGGGYLTLARSAGLTAGDLNSRANFGFNVKYNKSGTNLQGRINTIVRSQGRVYQIKGNSMTSLSAQPATVGGKATFTGKASITDITNPLAPLAVDGNATLQVTMSDNGEPGNTDAVGITVWNKSGGLWFSSNWTGTATIEQVLAGGNLVVR